MKRLARIGLAVVLALALAWAGGLLWFIRMADRPIAAPPQADGIVALTGGAGRVEAALRLLAEGRAPRLLVSGVGGTTELGILARRAGVDPVALAPDVTLGRAAVTTRGNATETAEWVRAEDIHALIVVTGYYHMPRALAELGRALPGVTLFPVPVVPSALQDTGVANLWPRLRLLAGEYTKYLVTQLGLSGLAGRDDLRGA